MDAEAFVQGVVIFLICITFTNIAISFFLLCFENLKKCSIMDGENQKKKSSFFTEGKKKKYAVLKAADKAA